MNYKKIVQLLAASACAFCAIVAFTASAATLQIEKVVPFTTATSLRIDATLKSSEAISNLDLVARISRVGSSEILWDGPIERLSLGGASGLSITHTINKLKPQLWSPGSPALYTLELSAVRDGATLASASARIGFRTFESRNGQFLLNGHPIFLRGLAINPPGRTIPDAVGESREFAEAYVRYMKKQNLNAIRMTHDSQVWFDVCDELGMLVFQGQYGSPLESETHKQNPPPNFTASVAAYKSLFETYARHPAICIYILSNEMPYTGKRGKALHEFLDHACRELEKWDNTRLYIGNAGYGQGHEGDICDVHRYWGWYYNSFLTYYNLRDKNLFGDPGKKQPLTFTECVGNFTGPLGEYNIVPVKQLGAQLNWTGHSGDQRDDALAYQAFMLQQATESFRRLRPLNPRISGIMPFTILFYNWAGVHSFAEMKPKPAAEQIGVSYQPVLLSWECWTPQIYAGATLHPTAHVVNDSDDFNDLIDATLVYTLKATNGETVLSEEIKLPRISYYDAWSRRLNVKIPAKIATGDYLLKGEIVSGNTVISSNQTKLFIAGNTWNTPTAPEQPVSVYDPTGHTAKALRNLGIAFSSITDLHKGFPTSGAFIIGENAWDRKLSAAASKLKRFIDDGGRILCLQQPPEKFHMSWLPESIVFCTNSASDPTYPPLTRPFRDNMHINPERPEHPVFDGLNRYRFELWSDYTDWNQNIPGFPRVYPVTAGFKLQKTEALANTAILADYDRGLEGVALCEMFHGRGSVIVSAFDIVNRAGIDPVADRFLHNLVLYSASLKGHEPHPQINAPIQWGNYPTEHGVVSGPISGLVPNAEWVPAPANPGATPLRAEEGSWNMRPGDQFVAHGRRPFGPYGYSTGTSLKMLNHKSEIGTGIFWARVPAGAKNIVTIVKNPETIEGEFTVVVDEKNFPAKTKISGGQMISIRTPITSNTRDVSVRYTGTRSLVLLETKFEQ